MRLSAAPPPTIVKTSRGQRFQRTFIPFINRHRTTLSQSKYCRVPYAQKQFTDSSANPIGGWTLDVRNVVISISVTRNYSAHIIAF